MMGKCGLSNVSREVLRTTNKRTYLLLACYLWAAPCLSGTEEKLSDLEQLADKTRTLRELIQSDPHRPIYHFVAPEGHAQPFDPNGAIYWHGKYHLGYIYQKTIDGKRRHVWGHVVSTDLLHWTIYPDMLDVKEGDAQEGIFSGGAFLTKEGEPRVVFYGLGAAANFMAYPTDDDLKVWKKVRTPILKDTGSEKYSVFDPEVWYDRNSDNYYQISGGDKPGLFRSRDLSEWQYLGPVISTKDAKTEPYEDLSCPDFFALGDKWMLLFLRHAFGVQYYIGTFTDSKFTPEKHGQMNWPGGSFFAPEQLADSRGRNIIWGWVVNPPGLELPGLKDYGWGGVMSLPRVVSLNSAGELQISPAEELRSIRLDEVAENDVALQPHQEMTLRANGSSVELQLEFAGGSRSQFGVKVFASPDGREATIIRYEPVEEQLVIDVLKSSMRGPTSLPAFNAEEYDASKPFFGQIVERFTKRVSEQKAPLKLQKGETLKADIFLDRSIIEVFANGRQAVTQVVYPELETSTGIRVFSGNESVTVRNIHSWKMAETNAY